MLLQRSPITTNLDTLFWIVFFVLFTLACVVIVIAATLQTRKRKKEALEQAQQLGFTILPKPDSDFIKRVEGLFPPRASVTISNVARRIQGELTLYLLDIRVKNQGNGKDNSVDENGTLTLISPRLNLPPFLLVGRPLQIEQLGMVSSLFNQLFSRVGDWYGYKPLSYNLDSEFDRRYILFTNDEAAVRALFTDRLVEHLAQTTGYLVRAKKDMLLFGAYSMQPQASPTLTITTERINQARQLYEWIIY